MGGQASDSRESREWKQHISHGAMMDCYVWDCQQCKNSVFLPLQTVRARAACLAGSQSDERFVNFVCPECGYGTRRFLRDISIESSDRYEQTRFFGESFRCDREGCVARTRVHTLGREETTTANESRITPIIALPKWNLDGITCLNRHPIKSPQEILGGEGTDWPTMSDGSE